MRGPRKHDDRIKITEDGVEISSDHGASDFFCQTVKVAA
ncbi:hypothetical protein OL67_000681 [Phaeobacter piscinae]|nr:hypothetical protein OL67_000681 [Phaeobacter piscinae]